MHLLLPGNLIAFQLTNLALWAAAFAIGIAVVYGLNVPKRYALPPDNVQTTEAINIAYGGLSRFSWAVAVSWVIFACCRGYGGEFCFHGQLRSGISKSLELEICPS